KQPPVPNSGIVIPVCRYFAGFLQNTQRVLLAVSLFVPIFVLLALSAELLFKNNECRAVRKDLGIIGNMLIDKIQLSHGKELLF
ncbi:hypothetical protein ACMYZ5_05040, partial [Bacteroides sp. KG68]|uniref:hypothetical protein n=1 Tax=Bacteroides sp. KG68 TaxID=3397824 RepID=UPI003D955157